MDKSNIIIITHNCQTYICVRGHTVEGTWNNEIWTLLSSFLHDLIWMASEVFATLNYHFQLIYNYVANSYTQKVGN